MLLVYNYVLLKMSTWYSKHVEESNNIWRINNIQCITLVVLYGQFLYLVWQKDFSHFTHYLGFNTQFKPFPCLSVRWPGEQHHCATHHHHHHHHWRNSPIWAQTFLRSFRQPSLLLAAFLQFFSPNFLASSITPSSHLSFGLPLCLFPSTTAARTLLQGSVPLIE